jgi:hypothetical protein
MKGIPEDILESRIATEPLCYLSRLNYGLGYGFVAHAEGSEHARHP